ncbi:unnamed protein product [Mytilus coruscus]|uniref:Core-binding (CB) domain-containing protein n=1 Tax=Mytilus coruscus TaxID=42192 RepID=A0A6J8D0G5_MYTCO|nr:unnamed protein product [Mytilus coruscus]
MSQSLGIARVHGEHEKIQTSSESEIDLFRGTFRPGKRVNIPNTRTNRQVESSHSKNNERNPSDSFRFSSSSGDNGLMYRTNSKCSFVHETNSAPSSLFLETSMSRVQNFSPSDTTSQITSNLVVKFSEHAEGRSLQPQQTCITITTDASKTGYGGVMDKKIFQGEWSVLESKKHINYLELEAVVLTIKHFLNYLIGKSVLIRSDNTTVVQYINKQGGTKSPQLCYKTWELWTLAIQSNITLKATHIMGKKSIIADYLSRKKILHRVVTEHSNCTETFSLVGPTSDGFICLSREPSDESVLLMDSTSPSFCLGCPDNILGENVCLCISPNLPDTQDIAIYEAVLVSDSPDSSFVAQETLVPGITSTIDRLPSQSPDTIRPSLSTEVPSLSSGPGASWRKGTQKDYSAKFKKYCSWCSTREINPHNATLNQVADFLVYLFESGLQYRTIAGYRSMLSNVLPQVDNTAVGQHPYITRLIKGVFSSRPPTTKLLPEWDLQLVLTLLQNEPIENIDLKHLTFKTVFLISITTFRRCSDLQSLRVNHSFMRIQQKGITFIRCGLAKQDRQNHRNSKIVVPAFTDNKKLDPVTCLLQYIERTKKFRSSLDKDQQENYSFLHVNRISL